MERHDSHPGGDAEKVIEPAWLWPHPTMRSEREEMPGIRITGMPTPTLMGNGERPAVTIRSDPRRQHRPIN